jgi:menaquinone-dependent protoporphyrinogen oxidase
MHMLRVMSVLVAYATAHGSTKGVAQAIAKQLSASGLAVDLRAADDSEDVHAYDAVVLGSAVHNGRWLTPATTLLTEIGHERQPSLWLFSVCTVGETTSFLGPRLSRLARHARKLPPGVAESHAPHRFFAGVIEREHWNAVGRLFFVLTGGRYGDHRDWTDIDQWATQIGAVLAATQSE